MKKLLFRILALGMAAALLAGSAAAVDPRRGPYFYGNAHCHIQGSSEEYDLGKSFVRGAGIMTGDGSGDMNWMDELTRVEAATIIIRLMGLEEEAKAAASRPSPFTDVPQWANGYVNLAYEKGVVKGIGSGLFGSTQLCGAREFVLMLFRLTHLEEGVDYTWETALADLTRATAQIEDERAVYQYYPAFPYASAGAYIQKYSEKEKSPFTREVAAEALYLMLSIVAGENQESLADILVEDYGFSSLLCYDYSIRRGVGDLAETLNGSPEVLAPANYALLHAIRDPAFYQRLREEGRVAGDVDPEAVTLAQSLTEGLTSDYDKVEAISEWICTHIFYDVGCAAGQESESIAQGGVMKSRTAVCLGYSRLTSAMLTAVGVECYYIISISADHAWNMAYVDGRWMVFDNTFGASRLKFQDDVYTYWTDEGSWVEVADYLEPNVPWTPWWKEQYFDVPMDDFYADGAHELEKDPPILEKYERPDRFWDPTWTGDR